MQIFSDRAGSKHSYYTRINTHAREGLGEVMEKNVVFEELPGGHGFGVVKSANLDAWYITSPGFLVNEHNIFRLDSSGLELHHQQTIGEPTPLERDGGKFSRFSPDGQHFAMYHPLIGLELFDFDREAGVLSNARFTPTTLTIDSAFYGGWNFHPTGVSSTSLPIIPSINTTSKRRTWRAAEFEWGPWNSTRMNFFAPHFLNSNSARIAASMFFVPVVNTCTLSTARMN